MEHMKTDLCAPTRATRLVSHIVKVQCNFRLDSINDECRRPRRVSASFVTS